MKISLPEQVWIDLEPASFGSRALAYLLDFLIRWTAVGLIAICIVYLGSDLASWTVFAKNSFSGSYNAVLVVITLLIFVVEWSYPMYFELFHNGISPGKRAFGLQVVDERGLPIAFRASFLRTAISIIDMMPAAGFVAFCSMLLTKRSQRLGDLVAKTIVVHQAELVRSGTAALNSTASIVLPLDMYNIMARYFEREAELLPAARSRMQQGLVNAVRSYAAAKAIALPEHAPAEEQARWLEAVFKSARPAKVTAARSTRDAAINWKQLEQEFETAEALFRSLQSRQQTEESLLKTAAHYQLLCQRYGYLSTFYPETIEARRASQLVRQGRSLIYSQRLERVTERRESFLQRAHRSFALIRSHVAVAGAVGITSALLAAALVQINPNILWHFLSEEAAQKLSSGSLWTEQIRGISGLAASRILTNNISVTLSAFALGITGGVGTMLVLIFNGAHFGGIFSALTFYQMAFPLLDFVVAHGFLELSVIIVAGGAGLFLGDALLNPGHLSRKKALQQNGAVAVELILFNALCLVLAGVVEGYISPYREIPFYFKLSLGLVLGAGYWWYLFTGALLPFRRRQA